MSVRIETTTRRKILLTCVAAMPLVYVTLFGPACWLHSRRMLSDGLLETLYRPIFDALSEHNAWDVHKSRGRLTNSILWYAEIDASPLTLLPSKPRHAAVIDGKLTWWLTNDSLRGGSSN
jgi:hypothetical protein